MIYYPPGKNNLTPQDFPLPYRLPPLSALRTFEAAARYQSFKRAAEALNVTPAAVSQQIRTLESWLGVALFVRKPAAMQLTDAGAAMYPHIREGLNSFAAGVESVGKDLDCALDVIAPPAFATRWLVPRLARFSAQHPEVAIRIVSDPGAIDGAPMTPSPPGIREPGDGSAVTIRLGEGSYPGYQVDLLQSPHYVLACNPRLLTGEPPLRSPEDLRVVPLIHDESIPSPEKRPSWEEWFRLAGVSGVEVERGPRFSNQILALEAALDGQGVALLLQPQIETELAAGRLVTPFAIRLRSAFSYYLLTPTAVAGKPAVLAFRQWLLNESTGG